MRQDGSGRCCIDYADGTACETEARYVARLNWTNGLMFLCPEHAMLERAHGDVVEIKSLRFSYPPAID